jgi:hypothetical protein
MLLFVFKLLFKTILFFYGGTNKFTLFGDGKILIFVELICGKTD